MELFNNAWPAAVLALGLGSVFALILLIAKGRRGRPGTAG
jgi:integral membrane sensor domain MASE1